MLTGRDRFEGDGSEEDGTATRDRRGLARIGKRLRKNEGACGERGGEVLERAGVLKSQIGDKLKSNN